MNVDFFIQIVVLHVHLDIFINLWQKVLAASHLIIGNHHVNIKRQCLFFIFFFSDYLLIIDSFL